VTRTDVIGLDEVVQKLHTLFFSHLCLSCGATARPPASSVGSRVLRRSNPSRPPLSRSAPGSADLYSNPGDPNDDDELSESESNDVEVVVTCSITVDTAPHDF
jgi:hypothetical protein